MCAKIKPVDILLRCSYCFPRSPNFNVGTQHGTSDFTQTANTVTLGSGATVNDEIVIVTEGEFINANHHTKSEVTTLIANDNVTDDGNSLLNALIFGG